MEKITGSEIWALHSTDEHFNDRGFKSRLDDPLEAGLEKLRLIGQILSDNTCIKRWYSSGDFFHTHLQSSKLINKIGKIFEEYDEQAKKIFPIHIIAGNHLEKGNSALSIEQSGLKTLENLGYFSIKDDPYIDEFHDRRVLMNHISITQEKVPWKHKTYEQIEAEFSCDYCLCSHDHTARDFETVGKTTFSIPGSMLRGTGHEDPHREPRIAVFSLTGQKSEKYITLGDSVSYPFAKRSKCNTQEIANSELVQKINTTLDSIGNKSMAYEELIATLLDKGDTNDKIVDYLQGIKDNLPEH